MFTSPTLKTASPISRYLAVSFEDVITYVKTNTARCMKHSTATVATFSHLSFMSSYYVVILYVFIQLKVKKLAK